jgi:hypothetical protein
VSAILSCSPAHAGSPISYLAACGLSDSTSDVVSLAILFSGPTVVPFPCDTVHPTATSCDKKVPIITGKIDEFVSYHVSSRLTEIYMGCKGSRVQISALRPITSNTYGTAGAAAAINIASWCEPARGIYIGRPLAIHSSVLPIESRYRAQLYGCNCSSSTRERS